MAGRSLFSMFEVWSLSGAFAALDVVMGLVAVVVTVALAVVVTAAVADVMVAVAVVVASPLGSFGL